MKAIFGFTLIESLITLAILMSSCAVGIPSLLTFLVKTNIDNEMYRLFKLLQTARNSAITYGQPTTLCPLDIKNQCSEQWQQALSVFIDSNNNKIFEPLLQETLIAYKDEIKAADILQYGKGRNGVTYSPTGFLAGWGQNGTFKYCPNKHLNLARGIIVATSGRIYKTYQTASGVDKTRRYQTITCR